MRFGKTVLTGGAAVLYPWGAAQAQEQLNRADPSIISRSLPRPAPTMPSDNPVVAPGPRSVPSDPQIAPRLARAIVVEGAMKSRATASGIRWPAISDVIFRATI